MEQTTVKRPSKKHKMLTSHGQPRVFMIDEEGLARRRDKLELAYLNVQLKDPNAFVSRLAITKPEKDASEVLKTMVARRDELVKQLMIEAKRGLGGKRPAYAYDPWFRPSPPPNGIVDKMAATEIFDVFRELTLPTASAKVPPELFCEMRKGCIAEPSWFAVQESGDCESVHCEGGMSYRLEDGSLPFMVLMENTSGSCKMCGVLGELGYTFPRPQCDSRLTWDFYLGAGAELNSDADNCRVWLDCHTVEHKDTSTEPPSLPITLMGSVLDLDVRGVWDGISPDERSGSFDVRAGVESTLYVCLYVTIVADDNVSVAEGFFQVFKIWGGFSPGVRYRLDPHDAPT